MCVYASCVIRFLSPLPPFLPSSLPPSPQNAPQTCPPSPWPCLSSPARARATFNIYRAPNPPSFPPSSPPSFPPTQRTSNMPPSPWPCPSPPAHARAAPSTYPPLLPPFLPPSLSPSLPTHLKPAPLPLSHALLRPCMSRLHPIFIRLPPLLIQAAHPIPTRAVRAPVQLPFHLVFGLAGRHLRVGGREGVWVCGARSSSTALPSGIRSCRPPPEGREGGREGGEEGGRKEERDSYLIRGMLPLGNLPS